MDHEPNEPTNGGTQPGSADGPSNALDEFIQELTAAQTNLRAYIMASLGSANDVPDVLQRTNLTLWKKAAKFQPGSPFMPWAVTIAKFEVLAHCRDKSRDRHVYPEDLANLMSATASDLMSELPNRQLALRQCLETLPGKQSDLLRLRYHEENSIAQIAAALQRTEDSVKSALLRIRKALAKCIDSRIRSIST